MEYKWGDAENTEEYDEQTVLNNVFPHEIHVATFNICWKDLIPETKKELLEFLEACKDPRKEQLHEDFVIARTYSVVEE